MTEQKKPVRRRTPRKETEVKEETILERLQKANPDRPVTDLGDGTYRIG